MFHRRHFLQRSSLISLSPIVPTFITKSVEGAEPDDTNDRKLVVIQLDGGNDGLCAFDDRQVGVAFVGAAQQQQQLGQGQ